MIPKKPLLASAFFVSTLLVGIPFWQIPYSQVALPNSLFGLPLIGVLILAAGIRLYAKCSFRETLIATGAALPAAVLCRIAVETSADPSTHNLWPFEVIITCLVGLVVGVVGAGLGGAAIKLTTDSDT